MFHATASRLAAVTLSGVALAFLAFAASGAPQATASGLSSFQDDEAGYLGVSLGDEGLSVSEVTPGTAAAAAGLQPGDRIVWIADRDVETYEQLVAVLKRNPPGSEVGIVYLRGDQVLKKKLVLGSRSKPKLERVEEEGEHDQAQVQDEREVLRRVLEEFEGQEGAARAPGFLGINLGDGEGVVVGSVVPGTAAERGKLQAGDRLVALDDTKIGSLADLRKALAARPAGTKVVVTVQRGDMLLRSAVQLGRADGEEAVAPDQPGDEMRQHIEEQLRRAVEGLPRRDVAVIDQPGFLGVYLDEAQEGAVVSGIVPGSAAEKAKLQPGDRILALGDRKISSTDELRAAIAARAAGSRVGLRLVRGDQVIGLELPLGAREESDLALPPGLVLVPGGEIIEFEELEELEDAEEIEAEPRSADRDRDELERVLRELQAKGAEQSRRWAGAHDERMGELGRQLREQSQNLERTLEGLRRGAGRELLDGPARERLREELQRWGEDRARVLRENGARVREVEEQRLQHLGQVLRGLRQGAGAEAGERLRDARRRLAEAEKGVGEILRRDVAPQGRAALEEVRQTLGSLRQEMEGLRAELQNLRRALGEVKSGR